jgi:3-oxoacyl-[acyl-carrier-protein] synthase-3
VARAALHVSGVDPARIGVIVNTSVTCDFYEPSEAVGIHHALGLSPSCMAFDITNACVGMMNGLAVVGQMIEAGVVDYGLIVSNEVVTGLHVSLTRSCM